MPRGEMMEAIISLSGVVSPELQGAIESAEKHLNKMGKALKKGAFVAAVASVPVMTAKAVAEAGKYLADLGDDWNTTMNDLSASTGATGAELEALGEAVKGVYAKGLGDDFKDVADGLAVVKQNSGLVGEELEAATASAFVLRDTFEYEIGESSRAAAALMKNFGLTAEEAYGLIATGAQNGADKNGDLLDTLNEYSAQYAALGLSADQFMGSLIEGADAGLFSIDKIGDAVKEFNIRAKDGSDSSREAFEGLGLNADRMFEAFAAGGDTAEAAFFDTVEALNALEDPLLKNQIGVALFGSQFEDLEAGVLPVLADIETAAYDGADALQHINDVKYNDLGSALEQIKRSAEVTLLPMASTIANALTALAPILTETFEAIQPVITQTLDDCMPFVQDFLKGMGDVLKKVLPLIANLASSLLPILTELMSTLLPPILDLVEQLLPPLIQIVQAILPPIASILTAILPMLTQIIAAVLPVLTQLIASLLPVITPLLDMALQLVNAVIMPLLPMLVQIIESLLPPIMTLLQALIPIIMPILDMALQLVNDVVMPLMPPIIQLVEALLPPILSLLNAILPVLTPILSVLEPIASVLGTIVGFISEVVGWVADGFGWVVDLFTGGASAPAGYATGGFTSGPSIAGEDPRYPTEAVISFNPAYRAQNLSYWARAGKMLGAMDEGSYEPISSGSGTSVVYDLSGLSFSPTIKVDGNTDEDALIRKLRDLEPEFIDFILEALARREGGAYVTADSRLY